MTDRPRQLTTEERAIIAHGLMQDGLLRENPRMPVAEMILLAMMDKDDTEPDLIGILHAVTVCQMYAGSLAYAYAHDQPNLLTRKRIKPTEIKQAAQVALDLMEEARRGIVRLVKLSVDADAEEARMRTVVVERPT